MPQAQGVSDLVHRHVEQVGLHEGVGLGAVGVQVAARLQQVQRIAQLLCSQRAVLAPHGLVAMDGQLGQGGRVLCLQQLRHIGHLEALSPTLQEKVLKAIERTKYNDRLVLNLAFNYGGRDEIVCAIRDIIRAGLQPDEVTSEVVSSHMFTAGIPDPDLIVRTSGEMRISNFLIWQGAYSEWYVTSTYWPDFDREEMLKALVEYGKRDRRYGRVSSHALKSEP